MSNYPVRVLSVTQVTHNVHHFEVEKPEGFMYKPGQATDLSILKEGWEQEKRPFTFTSLPGAGTLEFTIKSYTNHDGVTNQLLQVKPGDMFEISDAWGTIEYKGEGVFIAGGAGVTPFIAILRHLYTQNKIGDCKLLFANKTASDIILKDEFEKMLGENLINILSEENTSAYYHGRIDKAFLQQHITNFAQPFYVCGPDPFNEAILTALKELGANPDALVFEK
ncbi:MAG TPA: FAD-binding oxidoreductase [Chitinophagaceae bacterium]|nr:FAD-binding oxidoreductase [Chitinophagaceae bacterium]